MREKLNFPSSTRLNRIIYIKKYISNLFYINLNNDPYGKIISYFKYIYGSDEVISNYNN